MTDVLTTGKSLTKQTVGGNSNTWGTILNSSIDLIDKALAGTLSKALVGNVTLNATEAQNVAYVFTGTPAACTVTWPTFYGPIVVHNTTAVDVTCGMASGSAAVVAGGASLLLHSDGTNFRAVGDPLLYPPRTAPGVPAAGWAMYTDSADGFLKIQHSSGTIIIIGTP